MNKKETYTYEDWLNGLFGSVGNEDDINKLHLDYVDNGKGISATTYKEIKKSQIQAFDWAVEIGFDVYKRKIQREIDGSNYPDELLSEEIKDVENFIEENRDIYKQRLKEHKDLRYITGAFYRIAKESYKKYKNGKHISLWIPDGGTGNQRSRLQLMYIYKEYLPFLKELKENLDVLLYSGEDNPPNPWNILVDGAAISNIELFIKECNVSEQNEDIAKSFLAAAEIMAKDGRKEEILKSRTGAAREIAKHPYFKDKKLPTEKTTGNRWLKTYLEDYRGEKFFGT